MKFGYARVSTVEQNADLQHEALRRAGVAEIFTDTASGANAENRPELQKLFLKLRAGDELVVWKLDRLSRSSADLERILSKFDKQEVKFHSLTEALNTEGPAGQMLIRLLGIFAQFERDTIRERTQAGLERARARGQALGRPSKLNAEQCEHIRAQVRAGKTAADMARTFRVSQATVSRILREQL